jgi:hypothetical protein
MATCSKLETCAFYQTAFDEENVFANRLKQIYCLDREDLCIRDVISELIGKEYVPDDLYPNDIEKGKDILKENL